MKKWISLIGFVSVFLMSSRGWTAGSTNELPPPPPPPPFLKSPKNIKDPAMSSRGQATGPKEVTSPLEPSARGPAVQPRDDRSLRDNTSPWDDKQNLADNNSTMPPLDFTLPDDQTPTPPNYEIPHGQNLVSIDFPNGVELTDIIKTIGIWSGKNFVLGQGVASNIKISIIAPEPMTKEEAYQTFLSALNISGFTTVETGKIIKILPIPTAKTTNIKTYYGSYWAPETDEYINQVIPLHFIDAKTLLEQLRPLMGLTQSASFSSTNSIVLTDTGFRIKSLLEIIKLLDNKKDQAQVEIVPINHMDAKDANQKITDIFGIKNGPSVSLSKSIVDERTNSLILIGPARGLDDVVKFIKRIDVPSESESNQGLIRVRPLDYANAEKLAQTLQTFSASQAKTNPNQFPGRFPPYPYPGEQAQTTPGTTTAAADLSNVKIAADVATNALIILGSRAAYDELESIIQALDKRRNQIYLEADVLDLVTSNGLDWKPSALGGSIINGKRFLLPYGFNPAVESTFSLNNSGSTQDFQSALAATVSQNFLVGLLSATTVTIGGFPIRPGAILFALKTDSNTNILQTPSMLVSDNETAKFNSTQQYNTVVNIPNPNGQGTVPSPQTYNVVTALTVTPQNSRADYINLKINLQIDDAGPANTASGYPNPINKRSAESVVTVRSGQTAVMGGIMKDSNKKIEAKIPLLGDIPILGWLFKIVSDEKIKSNLTMFLTPYVVKNSEDLAKIYDKKIKERDEFLKLYYGKNFKKEDFYKKLPDEQRGKAIPETTPIQTSDTKNPASSRGDVSSRSDVSSRGLTAGSSSSSHMDPAVKPRDDIKARDDSKSWDDIKSRDDTHEQVLPSQNKDPIMAPVQEANANPFHPALPPPPPPPLPNLSAPLPIQQ